MRLDSFKQEIIKRAFIETFEKGDIYLFGSRMEMVPKEVVVLIYI